jgi:NAD(P)-dependent dehydrogenase (short-subunit alcohol dehydrogenase family)
VRQTVVITGASQGIGAAIARALAETGRRLALVSRNRLALEKVAAECTDAGAQAAAFPCDLTDQNAVRKTAAQVCDRFGVPEVVVNNAGAFVPGSILDTEARIFREQVEVNLTSAFMVTRAFLPGMMLRGSGQFVFMGSVASVKGYPGGVAYCAAKHGLLGLARALREESRSSGIRVTTLLPGATMTPSWEGTDLPQDRFMPPEDLALLVRSAIEMSERSVVEEILVRPQLGDL